MAVGNSLKSPYSVLGVFSTVLHKELFLGFPRRLSLFLGGTWVIPRYLKPWFKARVQITFPNTNIILKNIHFSFALHLEGYRIVNI